MAGEDRLLEHRDLLDRRQLGRVVDVEHLARLGRDAVDDRGRGGDQVEVVLALEPLLDDLHVQQAEVAATKPEAERLARLGLDRKRGVVEPQLGERLAQILVVGGVHRVDPREDHRLDLFEAGERLVGRLAGVGDRVAHLGVGDLFDVGDEQPDLAGAQLLDRHRLGRVDRELLDLEVALDRHQRDLLLDRQHAVEHAHEHHHAAVAVVPAIEDERLERRARVALGRRNTRDDRLEHLLDALALLGRGEHRVRGVQADNVLDLLLGPLHVRGGQVDLVDDRDDLEVVVERHVDVGERLRLDPLRRVDDQQRPLARGERARDLVGEVDVARRVDEVELVLLAVLGPVAHANRLGLDGDPALALQLHVVEELVLLLAVGDRPGLLEQPVGERGLAVIDVGDDREVSDVGVIGRHAAARSPKPPAVSGALRSTQKVKTRVRTRTKQGSPGPYLPRDSPAQSGDLPRARRAQSGAPKFVPAGALLEPRPALSNSRRSRLRGSSRSRSTCSRKAPVGRALRAG